MVRLALLNFCRGQPLLHHGWAIIIYEDHLRRRITATVLMLTFWVYCDDFWVPTDRIKNLWFSHDTPHIACTIPSIRCYVNHFSITAKSCTRWRSLTALVFCIGFLPWRDSCPSTVAETYMIGIVTVMIWFFPWFSNSWGSWCDCTGGDLIISFIRALGRCYQQNLFLEVLIFCVDAPASPAIICTWSRWVA